jgi:hypothetical protein
MNNLPAPRSENIVVQELGGEILIYDLKSNKAFCLNETSAIVYRACGENGAESLEKLKRENKFSDDLVRLALDDLQKNGLLAGDAEFAANFGGVSRRQMIKRVAAVSAIALPLVSTLVAPRAAHAASVLKSCIQPTSGSPCPRINCNNYCDGDPYDIVIVNGCRTCRCHANCV